MVKPKLYILLINKSYLHVSLEHYFRYVFKRELTLIKDSLSDIKGYYILFILNNDSEEFGSLCKVLYNNKIKISNIRTLGSNNHSDVNLLDYKNIKSNFITCLNSEYQLKRKNIPWVSDKISVFFKGHGDQSLLSCIGWVNYYLNNYFSLVSLGDIALDELNKTFLEPGILNWNEFVRKFEINAPFLYFAGWDKETVNIEGCINLVQKEIINLKLTNSFHIFGKEAIESLMSISDTIEQMANEWAHYHEKTQSADS